MADLIDRQDAINAVRSYYDECDEREESIEERIEQLPSAQPERLTDDDFETIRIHLNAYKEKLCNQHRWEEAYEYQRIIDRFMSFTSAQPERCEDCVNFSKTRLLIPQSEIIRCKDCKHSYETFAGLICSHGVCVDCVVRDDFYCSYGERKDA